MKQHDRVVCDYPLPDSSDQYREFLTRDFDGHGLDRYTITRDGRLIRHARKDRSLSTSAGTTVPEAMGRPASPEEFWAAVPRKL